MATPTYFTPEKKSDSDRPLPSPARSTKRQVYTNPDVFKAVDEHVTSVAKVGYRTFRDLIWNLVFKKKFDKLQTARAVFRWMTLKRFHNYTFDGMRANSPDAILQGFKQGITAHSRALECLATHAGLHCVILSGWAKTGENYELGAPFATRFQANHSWNAIYINGSWRLMESHWANRGNSEYDDWFFMPDANQFIYSHFPEDPKWQLSSQICSKAEFDQYPLTKSTFFNVGMKFLQQNQGIIFTNGGIMALTLGLTYQTALIFQLKYGDERSEIFQGEPLRRYVIQETLQNRVTYYFRAPRNGDYYLTIYAQDVPESLKLKELCDEAITFMVKCENAASKTEPFPEYESGEYGPGVELKRYGVTSSESKGLVKVYNGSYMITLRKARPVKFLVRLKNDALSPSQLENAVVLEDGENLAVVKCTLPQQGEYGVGIFANEPGKGTDTFYHVCQYLLSYKTQDFQTLYGHVYESSSSSTQTQRVSSSTFTTQTQRATSSSSQAARARRTPSAPPDPAPTSQPASSTGSDLEPVSTGDDERNQHISINVQPSPADLVRKVLNNPKDYYKMSAKPRGRVIVLNNETFDQSENAEAKLEGRAGSYFDVANSRKLFEALHFEVVVWSNISASEIRKRIAQECKSDFHEKADAFIFIILSHGKKSQIFGSDGRSVHINNEIVGAFDGKRCPLLIGKPKLFFIQACQGDQVSEGAVKHDSAAPQRQLYFTPTDEGPVHEKADVLTFYSTVPGYVSWRNTKLGTWFIRDVVICINNFAHKLHVGDIMTKVNNQVSKREVRFEGYKQMSEYRSTLTKSLYFLPSP